MTKYNIPVASSLVIEAENADDAIEKAEELLYKMHSSILPYAESSTKTLEDMIDHLAITEDDVTEYPL